MAVGGQNGYVRMTPRSLDLCVLALAEAEVKVREFVSEIQEEALANYEVALIDLGADRDDIDAELKRHRAELIEWRERAIENMRGMAERDGKSLQ